MSIALKKTIQEAFLISFSDVKNGSKRNFFRQQGKRSFLSSFAKMSVSTEDGEDDLGCLTHVSDSLLCLVRFDRQPAHFAKYGH
jgi:hypothetical protein